MKHSSSKTKERLVITIWQCKRSWKDLVLTGLVCCTVITGILGAIIGVKHPFFFMFPLSSCSAYLRIAS